MRQRAAAPASYSLSGWLAQLFFQSRQAVELLTVEREQGGLHRACDLTRRSLSVKRERRGQTQRLRPLRPLRPPRPRTPRWGV